MNIAQVIVELKKLKPDVPPDKDIVGFYVIEENDMEAVYLEYESDDIEINFGELEKN